MATKKDEGKTAGVSLAKVNEKVLDGALAEVGLESKQPLDAKVRALQGYYKGNYEEDELFACDQCGGYSVEEDDCCPFCGDASGFEEAPKAKIEEPPKTKAQLKAEAEAEEPAKSKKAKAAKPKKATPPEEPKAAIAKPVEVTAELVHSEKDLDDNVAKIRECVRNLSVGGYDLGEVIKHNFDGELWRLRSDEEGKPRYRTFAQFVASELGISHTWAYQLMDIVKDFTRKDVEQIGTTKLGLVLKAKEGPERTKLLAAAKSGASKRELTQALKDARNAEQGVSPEQAAAEERNKKRVVAVPIALGRKTVTMHKRPKKAGDVPAPAKRLADQPYAIIELDNDVQLMIRVQTNSAGIVQAVVQFARDEK